MKAASWIFGIGIALSVIAAPDSSWAQASSNPPVSQVVYFDVNDDPAGFLALVQKARGIRGELSIPGRLRVFQASIAGEQTGELAVVIEYAHLVEMAQATTKLAASPKWQELVAEAQGKGYRPINTSVFSEVGP